MNYQDPNQQNQYQDPNQQYQQPQYQQPQYQQPQYQQPQYQQPMYQAPQAPVAPVVKQPCAIGLVFSIIGLVFGILGLIEGLSAWACNPSCGVTCAYDMGSEIGYILPGLVPVIISVIGMVFGIIGRKKMAATGNSTAMGTVGMVLAIIGLAFAFIFFVACSVVPVIVGEEIGIL